MLYIVIPICIPVNIMCLQVLEYRYYLLLLLLFIIIRYYIGIIIEI